MPDDLGELKLVVEVFELLLQNGVFEETRVAGAAGQAGHVIDAAFGPRELFADIEDLCSDNGDVLFVSATR